MRAAGGGDEVRYAERKQRLLENELVAERLAMARMSKRMASVKQAHKRELAHVRRLKANMAARAREAEAENARLRKRIQRMTQPGYTPHGAAVSRLSAAGRETVERAELDAAIQHERCEALEEMVRGLEEDLAGKIKALGGGGGIDLLSAMAPGKNQYPLPRWRGW